MNSPSSNQGNSKSSTPTNYGFQPYNLSYGDKADLLEKIKPEHIVNVYLHQLQGERWEDNQWKADIELKGRALSKIGAWDIANLMLSVSSQNVALSNMTDDEIRVRALGIAKRAVKLCLRNYQSYQIRGVDHIGYIFEIVFSNTFITLKQAEKEGIRSLIKGTTSESRIVSEQQSGPGFISRFLNRGRRQ